MPKLDREKARAALRDYGIPDRTADLYLSEVGKMQSAVDAAETSTMPPRQLVTRAFAARGVEMGDNDLVVDGIIADAIWADLWPSLHFGAADLRAWLASLNGEDGRMLINSPGGDAFGAAEMMTMLAEYPGNITALVTGLAASAATLLLCGAARVEMAPLSQIMIHRPSGFAYGDFESMEAAAKSVRDLTESVGDAYAAHLGDGADREEILEMMRKETYISASDAVESGWADGMHLAEGADDGEGNDPDAAAGADDEAETAMRAGRRRALTMGARTVELLREDI